MDRKLARLMMCIVVVAAVLTLRCAGRRQRPLSADDIRQAMHESLFVSHQVVDSIIYDSDGLDLLAERLSRNPAAAGRLLEVLARKGGSDKAIADACARIAEQNRAEVPKLDTGGSR